MFKEKSDKEISLQILYTYDYFFKIKNAQINKDDSDIKMNNQNQQSISNEEVKSKRMLSDALEKDNDNFFTNEVLKELNEEFVDHDKEMNKSNTAHLPLLMPKEIPPNFKYAFDICALLKKYDANGNELNQTDLQKEFEIFIMKLERKYYNQLLPAIISKIIDRVSAVNINESFCEFIGPFIIGSYINHYHFFTETIDLLIYCSLLPQLYKTNPTIFEKVVTFLLKNLLIEASDQIILQNDSIGGLFKVLIKIKSTNIKICISFVDKGNQKYRTTFENIQLLSRNASTNKSIEKVILCKMLRLWRRKWVVIEIVPEIIDFIAEYNYTYSISEGFVRVLYVLYTMNIQEDYPPWIKEQIQEINDSNEFKNKISFACKNTFMLLSKKEFEKIFV